MRQHGFTLIELLVAMSICAVLASLAASNFSTFIEGRRVRASAEQLRDVLLLAGQEALKRNAPVIVQSQDNVITASIAAFGANDAVPLAQVRTKARVTNSSVTLNGSGRAAASTVFAVTPARASCKAAGGPVSCYNVQVQSGGAVRLCDPTYPSGDVRACL
jgi:type IV fimbrial biogenesis protein FimT